MPEQYIGPTRELVPAAPAAAVAGLQIMGVALSDWVLLLTLIYTVVQLIISLPKLWKAIKSGWR